MKGFAVAATLSIAIGTVVGADGSRDSPVELGRQVFERNCLPCHGPGIGYAPFPELPGTGALRAKYNGKLPALLTERKDLTPELVTYFVRHGVSVMPPYRKTEISDAELAALGAYLGRNNPGPGGSRRKN
jgi:mono/diheme cytochrome c family protein